MSDLIYLDHAATTAVHPDVLKEMLPYFTDKFGNPSSVYGFAANNKNKLTEARETIAGVLGAKPEEIYFTAGGSESDNWALKCTAEAYGTHWADSGFFGHLRHLLKNCRGFRSCLVGNE